MISSTTRERQVQRSRIITISGNVGSGKSTFLKEYERYLLERGEVYPLIITEKVEGNGLLRDMYNDPKRWTFTLQVDFILHKFESYKRAYNLLSRSTDMIVIIERDYLDFYIFLEFQLKRGDITVEEYDVYKRLVDTFKGILSDMAPRGKIDNYYIDTPVDICESRVVERGREFELDKCDTDYLTLLDSLHKNYCNDRKSILLPHDLSIEEKSDIILGKKTTMIPRNVITNEAEIVPIMRGESEDYGDPDYDE